MHFKLPCEPLPCRRTDGSRRRWCCREAGDGISCRIAEGKVRPTLPHPSKPGQGQGNMRRPITAIRDQFV